MKKILLTVILVVAVAGGVYFFRANKNLKDEKVAMAFKWDFKSVESGMIDDSPANNTSDAPHTLVTLMAGGNAYPAGTYEGTCSVTKVTEMNELSAVLCWWAGGGKEIGVFSENGKNVIKVGDVDEGDAETVGFRGNFKNLLEIK